MLKSGEKLKTVWFYGGFSNLSFRVSQIKNVCFHGLFGGAVISLYFKTVEFSICFAHRPTTRVFC